jgi:hypothetical protein
MSTVHEIEQAIRTLGPKDFAELRDWIATFDADLWDRQLEQDVAAGRLKRFAEEALRDLDHTSGAGNVQVFELTMDNPDDQDELNRCLRKPNEPNHCPPPQAGRTVRGEITFKTPAKKKGHRKGKS